MIWTVMTASAQMPNSVRSPYRKVALVRLTPEYAATGRRPAMISARARGVAEVQVLGNFFVGLTDRCAYRVALAEAEAEAAERNAIHARKAATAAERGVAP